MVNIKYLLLEIDVAKNIKNLRNHARIKKLYDKTMELKSDLFMNMMA